jgi:hypothetical protein
LEEREPGEREPVGEELLARAERERVDDEPVLVDRVVPLGISAGGRYSAAACFGGFPAIEANAVW